MHTGDLAMMDSDGYRHRGPQPDMIGGERVSA
jgi:hypothetical protein